MGDEERKILVVGGGISGMTVAVEAAEAGTQAVIVEKNPYLGGRVALLNQYFPKLCPPYCGMEINFRRIKQNPAITYHTLAEVESISGEPGNYEVTVRINPRYVNDNCTACGKCGEVCETTIPNAVNYGMDTVKAAYLPHAMAFPFKYVLAPEIIGTDEAKKCADACTYHAIDTTMKPETVTYKVQAVVWATGWDPYDATKVDYLGLGTVPNVITSVMYERLAAHSGPTAGKIVRPSDGKEVKSVAFVQCSGSRDEKPSPGTARAYAAWLLSSTPRISVSSTPTARRTSSTSTCALWASTRISTRRSHRMRTFPSSRARLPGSHLILSPVESWSRAKT